MTPQQFAQAHSPLVESLRLTGEPEFDHLVNEIKHPETTEALNALAPGHRQVEAQAA